MKEIILTGFDKDWLFKEKSELFVKDFDKDTNMYYNLILKNIVNIIGVFIKCERFSVEDYEKLKEELKNAKV